MLRSEELARKLATARAEKKALNELLATTHTAGDTPEVSDKEAEAVSEGLEEKPHLVLVVKADTQVRPAKLVCACHTSELLGKRLQSRSHE